MMVTNWALFVCNCDSDVVRPRYAKLLVAALGEDSGVKLGLDWNLIVTLASRRVLTELKM